MRYEELSQAVPLSNTLNPKGPAIFSRLGVCLIQVL